VHGACFAFGSPDKNQAEQTRAGWQAQVVLHNVDVQFHVGGTSNLVTKLL